MTIKASLHHRNTNQTSNIKSTNSSSSSSVQPSSSTFMPYFTNLNNRNMSNPGIGKATKYIFFLIFLGICMLVISADNDILADSDQNNLREAYSGELYSDELRNYYPDKQPMSGSYNEKTKMVNEIYTKRRSKRMRSATISEMDTSMSNLMMEDPEAVPVSDQTTMGEELLQSLSNEKSHEIQVDQRMLVHRGEMVINSYKEQVDKIVNDIISLVVQQGNGYVENRSEKSYGVKQVHLQLRVDSTKFQNITSYIVQHLIPNTTGSVLRSHSTSSEDVTQQFIDVSSRANTLKANINALQKLLAKSNNLTEIIQLQKELSTLTQQYESKQQIANQLQNQASLSTLKITIEERYKESNHVPLKSKWWNPLKPFTAAIRDMCDLGKDLGDVMVYALVWAIPLYFLVWICYKNCATACANMVKGTCTSIGQVVLVKKYLSKIRKQLINDENSNPTNSRVGENSMWQD